MEASDTSGWIQWALSGMGAVSAICIGWLMTYERRMTKTESKVDTQGKAIAVLYEKDSATNAKLDAKLDHLENKFEIGLQGVRDDIKSLIRAVAKSE